jgi:hypothetical protein
LSGLLECPEVRRPDLKICRLLVSGHIGEGTMNAEIPCSPKYPINRWALRAQDTLMVSAFGVWSVVLGVAPILLFRVLTN